MLRNNDVFNWLTFFLNWFWFSGLRWTSSPTFSEVYESTLSHISYLCQKRRTQKPLDTLNCIYKKQWTMGERNPVNFFFQFKKHRRTRNYILICDEHHNIDAQVWWTNSCWTWQYFGDIAGGFYVMYQDWWFRTRFLKVSLSLGLRAVDRSTSHNRDNLVVLFTFVFFLSISSISAIFWRESPFFSERGLRLLIVFWRPVH